MVKKPILTKEELLLIFKLSVQATDNAVSDALPTDYDLNFDLVYASRFNTISARYLKLKADYDLDNI